jgi:hypothetical protein
MSRRTDESGHVASVFANAAATARPVENVAARIVLTCPACGAPQMRPLDFRCSFCGASMAEGSAAAERWSRWSAFVRSVMDRVDALCAETSTGARDLIARGETNPSVLLSALGAVDSRVDALRCKMADVWGEEGFDDERGPAADRALAERRGADRHVSEAWARCKVRCMADLLRAAWPRVEAAMRVPVACTRCGGHLDLPVRCRAVTAACDYCGAANQCVPELAVSLWFHHAPSRLATEQVLEERLAMLRAAAEVEAWRDDEYRRTGERPAEPEASKRRREVMAEACFRAWIMAKARIVPISQAEQDEELEREMTAFRATLRC